MPTLALVLFDIDGTLLVSQGAGTRAMLDAARELHGEGFSFDGIDIAGRLDPLIWHDVARANGIADPAAHHDVFRRTYQHHLERRLAAENSVKILPGAVELIEALRAQGAALGLVTGNYPESGYAKFRYGGLDIEHFGVAAWGCDAPDRRGLPALAARLHQARSGAAIPPRQVIVIGDTPRNVDSAAANGFRSLAVATGQFSRAELERSGADLAVDDLSETPTLLDWIVGRRAAAKL